MAFEHRFALLNPPIFGGFLFAQMGVLLCEFFEMTDKRAIFYIDGFNLYYSALKPKPRLRWLNLKALADRIVKPDTEVVGVKYFSAPVSGKIDAEGQKKQVVYFRALKTNPQIKTIIGKFVIRKAFKEPVESLKTEPASYQWNHPAPEKIKVKLPEEKRTDVNLAAHLIYDACMDKFDIAYVVTNDTDFVDAIKMVVETIQKPVVIVTPKRQAKKKRHKNYQNNDTLEKSASGVYFIDDELLEQCQFPDEIPIRKGRVIKKPDSWR